MRNKTRICTLAVLATMLLSACVDTSTIKSKHEALFKRAVPVNDHQRLTRAQSNMASLKARAEDPRNGGLRRRDYLDAMEIQRKEIARLEARTTVTAAERSP